MCQLTGRLTEHKYKGSYEQIDKTIRRFSATPLLDQVNFWDQVVFSWITGNADMHLKNFSLYSEVPGKHLLTPAYDMLSTALVMPEDNEELALTLNGKKRKIRKEDFIRFHADCGSGRQGYRKHLTQVSEVTGCLVRIYGSIIPSARDERGIQGDHPKQDQPTDIVDGNINILHYGGYKNYSSYWTRRILYRKNMF